MQSWEETQRRAVYQKILKMRELKRGDQINAFFPAIFFEGSFQDSHVFDGSLGSMIFFFLHLFLLHAFTPPIAILSSTESQSVINRVGDSELGKFPAKRIVV